MHRICAGLPKSEFVSLQKSPDPYFCPHCLLKKQTSIISDLKATIASLTDTIKTLQTSVKSLEASSDLVSKSDKSKIQPKPVQTIPTVEPSFSANNNYEDKKYNIVMYGIKESPPKTSKSDRLNNDLCSITNEFTKVNLTIQANSIKDCFRLGKFKSDALRPRPILIKFLRSTEACAALAKIASFQAPVRIRPDLTSEEWKAETVLLKERWSLMQLGFDKNRIKIRNKKIFVDNKLYGQYQNSELCRSDYNPPLSLMIPTDQPPSSIESTATQ